MNIKDFFSSINIAIDITLRPNGNCQAQGEGCETLKSGILTGEYGVGGTPSQALKDYARLISGKRLVVHAWDVANRKEYDVPNLVSKKPAPKKTSRKRK